MLLFIEKDILKAEIKDTVERLLVSFYGGKTTPCIRYSFINFTKR